MGKRVMYQLWQQVGLQMAYQTTTALAFRCLLVRQQPLELEVSLGEDIAFQTGATIIWETRFPKGPAKNNFPI
jgi:hypothetical protein